MNIKKKIAVLLVLLGISIPLVLLFFQSDGYILRLKYAQYRDTLKDSELRAVVSLAIAWNSLSTLEDSIRKVKPPEGYTRIKSPWEANLEDAINTVSKYFSLIGIKVDKSIILFPDGQKVFLALQVGKSYSLSEVGYERKEPLLYEIGIPYRYAIGLGVLIFLIGIGFFIFSLFPRGPNGARTRTSVRRNIR